MGLIGAPNQQQITGSTLTETETRQHGEAALRHSGKAAQRHCGIPVIWRSGIVTFR